MSKIALSGNASGTGVLTIAAPNTNSDYTLTLPQATTTVVGTDATQTLTNKTFTGYTETVYTLGTSGSLALNPANGTVQSCTLAGNPTFTDSISDGQSIVLYLVNGSSYTVTWPTLTWTSISGNTAPTLTTKDTVVLWKIGSTLYGVWVGSST
jgi:hypothetical protein